MEDFQIRKRLFQKKPLPCFRRCLKFQPQSNHSPCLEYTRFRSYPYQIWLGGDTECSSSFEENCDLEGLDAEQRGHHATV